MTIPIRPLLIPHEDEKEVIFEMQALLAYNGALSRTESEGMSFGEIKWWFDWLSEQKRNESKAMKSTKRGRDGPKHESAASRFGFLKGRPR